MPRPKLRLRLKSKTELKTKSGLNSRPALKSSLRNLVWNKSPILE